MKYSIDYRAPITITAGDGSIPVGDGIPFTLWDDNHCIGYAVSEINNNVDGFIPIEWIKRYCDKQPKILAYGFSFESAESVAIKNMLRAWEKENETSVSR